MERQKDQLRSLRHALCGALVSLTVYLLGLMLWTHLTLSNAVSVEQLTGGTHLMMALAAACGALLCRVRGGRELISALFFWSLVVLIGAAAKGVDLRAAVWMAFAAVVGALAVQLPARKRKTQRRRGMRGKHKRRAG